jgi:rhodanese-related sulfurtransferase
MKKFLLFALMLVTLACQTTDHNDGAFEEIPPEAFAQKMKDNGMVLLDVRTVEEFAEGHLEGAQQYDYYETESFKSMLEGLDKSKTYLIYCRSGSRSGNAMSMMQKMGFTSVYNLDGGILAWRAAGMPVIR